MKVGWLSDMCGQEARAGSSVDCVALRHQVFSLRWSGFTRLATDLDGLCRSKQRPSSVASPRASE